MPSLIGTDEAGYGPNLGPLSICATAWDVPRLDLDLYSELSDVVSRDTSDRDRIIICDSKSLFSASGGIRRLESSVLAVIYGFTGLVPDNLVQLVEMFGGDGFSKSENVRYWDSSCVGIPLAADRDRIAELGARFNRVCQERQTRLSHIGCRLIYPADFNRLVQRYGNKAELLSAETMQCLQNISRHETAIQRIVCDKHGARRRYTAVIHQYLTDHLPQVRYETANASAYWWESDQVRTDIEFIAKGESWLPIALSSMIAKYVREIAMECWNRYWIQLLPGLRPTQGYPVDARRFKREIGMKQRALGIPDELIWRMV